MTAETRAPEPVGTEGLPQVFHVFPKFGQRYVVPRWRYLLMRLMTWRWREVTYGMLMRKP